MANKAMGNGPRWRQHAGTAGVAAIAAVFGLAGALVVSGREKAPAQAPIVSNNGYGADPALSNLANPGASTAFYGAQSTGKTDAVRVLPASAAYAPQSSSESYPAGQQAPAPIVRGNSSSQNESLQYNTQPPVADGSTTSDPNAQANTDPNAVDANAPAYANQGYADANAQESAGYEALEQADQAPPPLPEYEQPPAPDDNYLWTPGYWGYSTGYYWVPGAWVAPPFYGALWTPPWWGWYGGRYLFHRGYWGSHIGYYGGINYGHGYVGSGFYGGYWQGRNFYYNRSVTNVNISRVRNVYERPVVINNVVHNGSPLNRTSFNGPGGVRMQPRPYELAATREAHYAPVPAQVQVRQMAASNRSQFFAQNHGRPAEAIDQRPLGSNGGIATMPQRSQANQQQQFRQSQERQPQFGQGTQANQGGNLPGVVRSQANTPEDNRLRLPGNAVDAPRSDLIQQRSGLWNGNRDRNLQEEQQRTQQLRQQQRDAQTQRGQRDAADQQRNLQFQQQQQQRSFQLQQQQQHDAAQQQQRDVQLGQQQLRNQQFQQQREASEQQRNLQVQQQEQQRNQQFQQQREAVEQQRNLQLQQQQQLQRNSQFQQQREAAEQQRNLQFQQQQQQRQAMEQQRNIQFQQQQQQRMAEQQRNVQQQQQQERFQPAPQHIEARPAPQQMQPQHAGPPSGGMHGRPQ